jgi:hypothetical protein
MGPTQNKADIPAAPVGRSLRSSQKNGLWTPAGTPALDDGKLESDDVQLPAGQPQSGGLGVTTQSKPSFDGRSDSGSESESDKPSRQEARQPEPTTSKTVGTSKKAKTTTRDSTESDEADHPRLDDIMEIKFESGTAVDQVNTPSDKKAAGLQAELEAEGKSGPIGGSDFVKKQAVLGQFLSEGTTTENGYCIIGHKGQGRGYRFLARTGRKQFGLISGTDIGHRAQKTYFAGKAIRNATDSSRAGEEKLTEDNYRGIAFAVSSPFKSKAEGSKAIYPETYAGVFVDVANDYEILLVTRTVLRSAIGKGDADMDIDNYYTKNQLIAPWTVGPQRVLQRSVKLVEEPTKDFSSVPDKMLSSGNKMSSDAEASVSKSEIGLDILNQFSSAQKEALLKMLIASLMSKGV